MKLRRSSSKEERPINLSVDSFLLLAYNAEKRSWQSESRDGDSDASPEEYLAVATGRVVCVPQDVSTGGGHIAVRGELRRRCEGWLSPW